MKINFSISSTYQPIKATLNCNQKSLFESSKPLVMMLHGFATDRHEIGIYDLLAERLLNDNIPSLQIDFGGWGENSSEQLSSFSMDGMVRNVMDSISEFKKHSKYRFENFIAVGCSLGTGVALITQYKNPVFKAMVLISPVGDLKADFTKFLGEFGNNLFKNIDNSTLKESDSIAIPLSWRSHPELPIAFFKNFEKYDLKEISNKILCPILAIAGSEDFSKENAEQITSNYLNRECKIINDADHIFHFFEPEKNKISTVIEMTTSWLKQIINKIEENK